MSGEKREKKKQKAELQQVQLVQQEDTDRKRLLDAYATYLKKLVDENKISSTEMFAYLDDVKEKNQLTFCSPEDVTKFFEARAQEKIPFMAFECDSSGNRKGPYSFSDGDGTCYQGTLKPETAKDLSTFKKNFDSDPALKKELNDALKTGDEEKIRGLIQQVKSVTSASQMSLSELGTVSPRENLGSDSTPCS